MIFISWFSDQIPIIQVLFATGFTYFLTMLGSSMVFYFKKINQKVLDAIMGFSGGVMIAAAFFSLLLPAISICEELGKVTYVETALGFLFGGMFVVISDLLIDKTMKIDDTKKRGILLTSAVTLHNIPEGLVVGVAFGSIFLNTPGILLIDAILISLGIGLQNFPEGACVSLPLRRDGMSRKKAFFIGQASGIVEIFCGVIGMVFALGVKNILPFLLSFSAGAMICVVCCELVVECVKKNKILGSIGIIIGFIVMMILDLAFS